MKWCERNADPDGFIAEFIDEKIGKYFHTICALYSPAFFINFELNLYFELLTQTNNYKPGVENKNVTKK